MENHAGEASEEPIARLVGATQRSIKRAVGARVRLHGLSRQQFWVLVNLGEVPGLSVRGLARRLHLDEPATSRIVARLVERRLVRRSQDPTDGRRRALAFTPLGARVLRDVRPIAEEVRRAVEAGLSSREKETFRALLARVTANMRDFSRETRGGPGDKAASPRAPGEGVAPRGSARPRG